MANPGSNSSFAAAQKPIDKTRQPHAQPRGWIVAEQFSCFGNVCTSQWHIAGLLREFVNFCPFAKRIFDRDDQVFELNCLALTQVEDVEERAFVLERSHRSLNHVIDVSVIATRAAVPKLIDG